MNSRRQLLSAAAAAASLGAMGSWLWGHRAPELSLDSPFLGQTPRATLKASFEVLLPAPALADAYAAGVDSLLAQGDPELAEQLRTALLVLEHSVGWQGFSRLSLSERRQALLEWEASDLALRRQIFQALRKTAVFTAFSDPSAWEAIAYPGPLL